MEFQVSLFYLFIFTLLFLWCWFTGWDGEVNICGYLWHFHNIGFEWIVCRYFLWYFFSFIVLYLYGSLAETGSAGFFVWFFFPLLFWQVLDDNLACTLLCTFPFHQLHQLVYVHGLGLALRFSSGFGFTVWSAKLYSVWNSVALADIRYKQKATAFFLFVIFLRFYEFVVKEVVLVGDVMRLFLVCEFMCFDRGCAHRSGKPAYAEVLLSRLVSPHWLRLLWEREGIALYCTVLYCFVARDFSM